MPLNQLATLTPVVETQLDGAVWLQLGGMRSRAAQLGPALGSVLELFGPERKYC